MIEEEYCLPGQEPAPVGRMENDNYLFSCSIAWPESCSWVVSIVASYLRGPWFKYQLSAILADGFCGFTKSAQANAGTVL